MNGLDEQLAVERVDRARKRLQAAMSIYGPVAHQKTVTQSDLDEIAAAETELRAALADKDRILDAIHLGKRP